MPFDGTSLDAATRLLIAGRARVDEAWCQGHYRTKWGGTCMLGALGVTRTMRRTMLQEEAERRLKWATGGREIEAFNDELYRTKEDVLAAYDRAIAGEVL